MPPSSRLLLWRIPAIVAAAATLLFIAGSWLALRGTLGRPLGVPPPPAAAAQPLAKTSGKKLVLVLGDSLARGTGDESGRGFVTDVLDAMNKRGPAEIANLSVNGAESAEVRELVESSNVLTLAASADVIIVSVGGNDLSHAVPRGAGPGAGAGVIEDIGTARARYAENLRAILTSLRRSNAAAPILLLGLYDPFEDSSPQGRLGASVILRWNSILGETALAYPRTVVVPSFDLFQGRPDLLGADRFHPNRKGYEAIGIRMAQVLRPLETGGGPPAPAARALVTSTGGTAPQRVTP